MRLVLYLFVFLFLGCVSRQTYLMEFGVDGDLDKSFEITRKVTHLEEISVLELKDQFDRVILINRISVSDSKHAKRLVNVKKAKLFSVYDPNPSPYFAVLSKKIVCPLRFRLKVKRAKGFEIYEMFATDRLSIGACSEQDAKFSVRIAFLKCHNAVVEIREFTPIESSVSSSLFSFKCLP